MLPRSRKIVIEGDEDDDNMEFDIHEAGMSRDLSDCDYTSEYCNEDDARVSHNRYIPDSDNQFNRKVRKIK
jgi:hypothetical protein